MAEAAKRNRAEPQEHLVRGRRERAKQEKRERIIHATKLLFAKKGFSATTTQEIAELADIGTGTLFLYAQTKEDLLVMVFRDEMFAVTQAAFKSAPADGSLLKQILHVFTSMVRYHERDIEVARILILQVTIPPNTERLEDVRAMLDIVNDGIVGLIEKNRVQGKIRNDFNEIVAAEMIFSIYYTHLLRWLGGHWPVTVFLHRLEGSLTLALAGLEWQDKRRS
jgi:AcrR family transcriptional regulator